MSLPVFSLFPYSKKGDPASVETVRKIVSSVKASRISFMDKYFNERFTERKALEVFIPSYATLVPLPKSAPLLEKAQWPGRDICESLIAHGFGASFLPLLKRTHAVPKAAFQDNSLERPSVDLHYNSIELEKGSLFETAIKEIILVDDVVTQGRTAYACCKRITEQFPNVPVKLFALVRSDSFEQLTDWNKPLQSEIIFYPQSGKTFHKLPGTGTLGGLWG